PAEDRDADDPDVLGPARPRGVRVRERGEVERGGFREALAPSLDAHRAARREYVATLGRIRALAGDRVDPVHRDDGEDVGALAVTQADLVLVAGLARDVRPAFVPVDLQLPSFGAVVDAQIRDAP